jgi:pyruvate dehydrogenase E2 component (dihydrolipoamide acetyltransferase)
MATEVILPKVDMDMSTGTISAWHVKDGDTVKKGQALFDIETDKAAMEIEAPAAGVIRLGDTKQGTALPIGTVVAMIFAEGEAQTAVKSSASPQPVNAPPPPSVTPAKAGAMLNSDAPADGRVRATPLARRLAKQSGISLAALAGTGPRGRIVAADVKTTPPPVVAATVSQQAISNLIPLDGMRRTIAQRLTQSKQTVPHFYLSATCTIDQLLAMRERLNASAPRDAEKKPLWKLSINDFVIKAYAAALQRVPAANVNYSDAGIMQFHNSDVGVAVSVEGGLFTPIVRSAESKSLSAISNEVKDLAARARARKLQSHEYQGGTATVSNLGMYGVEQFNAIINPPHASILAVGAAVERFIPVNKQPVLATQMTVTLSVDHRAVDGSVGAELLAAIKQRLEDPALMLV